MPIRATLSDGKVDMGGLVVRDLDHSDGENQTLESTASLVLKSNNHSGSSSVKGHVRDSARQVS